MMSPGCTSSGRITSSSPTAQLARLSSVPRQSPPCRLNLSVIPAQVGQSMMSPGFAPAGTGRANPHSGQGTVVPMTSFPLASAHPKHRGIPRGAQETDERAQPQGAGHAPFPPLPLDVRKKVPKCHSPKPVALFH